MSLERAMKPLIERYYPGAWDEEKLAQELRDQLGTTFVLESSGIVIAFLRWSQEDDATVLYSVQVHEDHRGRGFGTHLIAEFENRAKKCGARKAVLVVHDGNHSRHLYEHLGYRESGRDGEFAAEMSKQL